VAVPAGVGQVDGDLGVVDLAEGAGVLALHSDRGRALLAVTRLIDHQHRLGVAEVLDEVVPNVVADGVLIPDRPAEQVLHAVRGGVPGVLGQAPAVLAWQVRKQPEHERASAPSGFDPGKPAGDAPQQLVEDLLPAGGGYAVARGHRLIFGCVHSTG
jgi:hypothetical protein